MPKSRIVAEVSRLLDVYPRLTIKVLIPTSEHDDGGTFVFEHGAPPVVVMHDPFGPIPCPPASPKE